MDNFTTPGRAQILRVWDLGDLATLSGIVQEVSSTVKSSTVKSSTVVSSIVQKLSSAST